MILAIDLGSTSFKTAVFDETLKEISFGSHPLPHCFGEGREVEIKVDDVHNALRGALNEAQAGEFEIRAISITSQAQTFTLVDKAGRARMPFLCWQDRRATRDADELEDILGDEFAEHSSFSKPGAGLYIAKVRMVRPAAHLMPLNLPTYIARLLTGASVTDENISAMSGLYSLILGDWWPRAMRACGVSPAQMPALIPIGEVAAATGPSAREHFGLPGGVPVVLAGNDQTAGGYAAELDKREAVLITLGTAQVAYACVEELPRPREGIIRGPYPGGLYYRMGADIGGSVVNWAKSMLAGCGDDPSFFATAAKAPPGSRGLVFDAELSNRKGAWRNIGLHHETSDMARSILETLSNRMAGMIKERLEVDTAKNSFLAAGGGSMRPLWLDMISRELGAPVTPADGRPLRGAARMALKHI